MKIPFLHNVRRGLATNSSSSHSLVFHAAPVASDDIAGAAHTDTEFGWDHFILDTLGEKLMYGLTQAIGEQWSANWSEGSLSSHVAEARAKYGHLFPEFDDDSYWESAISGYVDHQSRAFSEELVAKLRDPHVIVHGGNDNGGYPDSWDEPNDGLPEGQTREMLG